MEHLDQENLIATLESVTSEATEALLLPHNSEYRVEPQSRNESLVQSSQLFRDITPDVLAPSPVINLTFS